MAVLRTEFDFTLPKGYVGGDGTLHRHGTMRLATARDEIEPLRDASIAGPDDPYLTVLVLARVVTRLGPIESISTQVIEDLFAADLAFLQDLYGIINFGDAADVSALQASVLPPDSDVDDVADDVGEFDDQTVGSNNADMPVPDDFPTGRRGVGGRSRVEEVVSAPGQ